MNAVVAAPSASRGPEGTEAADLLKWSLPGHGNPLPSCGQFRFRGHRAGSETHFQRATADCARFVCPVCAGWARREASGIQRRILEALRSEIHRQAIHVVLSPPQDADYRSAPAFRRLRSSAYRVARARGFEGGCLIFHPVRIAKPGIRDRCAEGPHFHLLGAGWIRGSGDGYDADGWIVKGLGVRKRIYRTALYVLSHAGQATLEGNPALEEPTRSRSPLETVTWFGSMAYNRLRIPPETFEGVLCPLCGLAIPLKEWFDLVWAGSGPPPVDPGVADPSEWRATAIDRTANWYGEAIQLDL